MFLFWGQFQPQNIFILILFVEFSINVSQCKIAMGSARVQWNTVFGGNFTESSLAFNK